MAYCYICNEILNNRNRSEEHILPNAIGGKRSSYRLLCKTCNQRLGQELDIMLALVGAPYATQLQIKRDRGSIPVPEDDAEVASIDDNILLRAAAKVIVNYYLEKTKDRASIQDIIEFIRNGGDNKYCRVHHLNVSKRFSQEPHHIVIINGDADKRMLWGYFELFGELGFVVVLDTEYAGASVHYEYLLNPVTWDEPKWGLKIDMKRENLLNLVFYN